MALAIRGSNAGLGVFAMADTALDCCGERLRVDPFEKRDELGIDLRGVIGRGEFAPVLGFQVFHVQRPNPNRRICLAIWMTSVSDWTPRLLTVRPVLSRISNTPSDASSRSTSRRSATVAGVSLE